MSWRKYSRIAMGHCAVLAVLALAGCASVSSTAQFYFPYTGEVRAPKPKDAPVPIFEKPPPAPYKAIGHLAFSTTENWGFLRRSMEYNARRNGADAVILRSADARTHSALVRIPGSYDWIPVSGPACRDRKGHVHYSTTYLPVYRPGYVYPTSWTVTSIDSEMIVFKK